MAPSTAGIFGSTRCWNSAFDQACIWKALRLISKPQSTLVSTTTSSSSSSPFAPSPSLAFGTMQNPASTAQTDCIRRDCDYYFLERERHVLLERADSSSSHVCQCFRHVWHANAKLFVVDIGRSSVGCSRTIPHLLQTSLPYSALRSLRCSAACSDRTRTTFSGRLLLARRVQAAPCSRPIPTGRWRSTMLRMLRLQPLPLRQRSCSVISRSSSSNRVNSHRRPESECSSSEVAPTTTSRLPRHLNLSQRRHSTSERNLQQAHSLHHLDSLLPHHSNRKCSPLVQLLRRSPAQRPSASRLLPLYSSQEPRSFSSVCIVFFSCFVLFIVLFFVTSAPVYSIYPYLNPVKNKTRGFCQALASSLESH